MDDPSRQMIATIPARVLYRLKIMLWTEQREKQETINNNNG